MAGKASGKTLVHIQASEELVMRLKILAAKRNRKMYELVLVPKLY